MVLPSNFPEDLPTAVSDIAIQHLTPILGAPDKVVVDIVDGSGGGFDIQTEAILT